MAADPSAKASNAYAMSAYESPMPSDASPFTSAKKLLLAASMDDIGREERDAYAAIGEGYAPVDDACARMRHVGAPIADAERRIAIHERQETLLGRQHGRCRP